MNTLTATSLFDYLGKNTNSNHLFQATNSSQQTSTSELGSQILANIGGTSNGTAAAGTLIPREVLQKYNQELLNTAGNLLQQKGIELPDDFRIALSSDGRLRSNNAAIDQVLNSEPGLVSRFRQVSVMNWYGATGRAEAAQMRFVLSPDSDGAAKVAFEPTSLTA